MRWVAAALLSFVATQAPERPWVAEWLKEFAGDSRGAVIARMNKIDSLRVLEVDLDRMSENIPATAISGHVQTVRMDIVRTPGASATNRYNVQVPRSGD